MLGHRRLFPYCTTVLTLIALAAGCANTDSPRPMDAQCDNAIREAGLQLDKRGSVFAQQARGRIAANLVSAARIDQQHGHFAECLERAKRALALAAPGAGT